MASLTVPSSPSSLQLRFGHRCKGSVCTLLKFRSHLSDLGIRLVLSASSPSPSSSDRGLFRVRSGTNSNGPVDSFSGWSDSNGDDSQKKGGLGGILGAGLAGGLFLASITFAALSFNNSGAKLQMEPLATEQTAVISSDDTAKVGQLKNESNEIHSDENTKLIDESIEDETVTSNDTSNPEINGEAFSESVQTSGSDKIALDDDSSAREDQPVNSDLDSTVPEIDSLSPNTDSETEKGTLTLEGNTTPEETLNTGSPLDSSTGVEIETQSHVETLDSNIVLLESGDVVDSTELLEEAADSFKVQKDSILNPVAYDEKEGKLNLSENEVGLNDKIDKSESVKYEGSFTRAGIPAPSLLSAALRVPPGEVLVPAVVDQAQCQAFSALQVLKVIEGDAQPGELCTRCEYARWLVAASSLSRNTASKVYPAMYIENVSELAFDDVTPDDPDFSFIQGLAEAGLISSKLSTSDGEEDTKTLFSPESPLSRQDLVSWKMALEKRQLPEVNKNSLYKFTGYIDIDKINPDAWPALVADLTTGEQSITALAFGYTRLFQPDKPVTKAQAAIALSTGEIYEIVNEELARIEAETLAESAVNAHTALVAQVEKDLNAYFEQELAKEREKIKTLEKLAEEARLELKKLREEREEEDSTLAMGRAAVESEMEVLMKLRHEMVMELEGLMSNKTEISFERERINKLREQTEEQNRLIVQLKYELEVEKKALSMARAWAEEEAKRAREQARALEEARSQWESQGIKVVVDQGLQDDSSQISWVNTGGNSLLNENELKGKTESSVIEKLKASIDQKKVQIVAAFERLREKILELLLVLRSRAVEGSNRVIEVGASMSERGKRVIEDWKEGLEKMTQKPKS